MTLDLYSHLFPDRLDDIADRMDRAGCAPQWMMRRTPGH